MVLNSMYREACDYAYNLSPTFFTDIVHDAFVQWYDKTKKNLFDEKETVVMSAVKKVYWKKYFHKSPAVVFTDKVKQNLMTPEDEYIEQEIGISFIGYNEITQKMIDWEEYHTMYPKIYLN